MIDYQKKKKISPMANWEVFKSLEDLQEFLNSDNTEILCQGINRFRQHFGYSKDKSTKEIKEIDPNTDEKLSIVYEYLQTSPECKELFRIWDMQLRNNLMRLELSMPDLFSKIIKFTTTIPSLKSSGTIIIRNIIRNYMKVIRNNLCSEKLPLCQNTLKLLIIMNSHDLVTTKELLESFTYNLNLKELGRLLNIRRTAPKDKLKLVHAQSDIRTLYVRFILSFFVHGDANIKSNVLEIKNFTSSIFKGLSSDSYEFVDEVLRKTYDYIILDNDIKRKIKLSFFNNTWLLNQLLHLYNRRDPEPPESDNIVANIIHRFLLSICCTPGVGICFRDAGWYPFNFMNASLNVSIGDTNQTNENQTKVHNIILLQFIKLLKPTQDLRQQELLLKILEACPELVKPYLKASNLSFNPNLSHKWLASVTLLQKIISLSVPSFYIPDTQIYPENPPELNTIMDNVLPRIFDQITLVKCLNHSSSLIKYKTMIVLCLAFQKLDTVVHLINKAKSSKWSQIINFLYEEMMHRIPDIQVLLNLYKDLSSNVKKNDDSDGQIRNNLIHECILKLIKFYHLNFPKVITEVKLNIDNLIPIDFQENQLGFQLNILELLLLIAKSSWTINSEFKHLQPLLKLYLTTTNLQIRLAAQRILEQLLSNSIIFQHDPDEVSIWLDSLPRIFPENTNVEIFNGQTAVLQFLDNCFASFLKDPNPYIDNLNQVINNVNERKKQDTIDDGENGTQNIFKQFLTFQDISKYPNTSYPFSPLIVILIENCKNTRDNKTAIMKFLHMLLKKLFTKQPLVYYLNEYIKQLENNVGFRNIEFLKYIGRWEINEFFSSLEYISRLYRHPNENSLSVNKAIDIPVLSSEMPQEELNILNQTLMKAEKLCLGVLKDKSPADISKARSKFLDMFYILPTSIFERNLVEILNYVKNVLLWIKFEPILEYIYERYPGSGSLFNIQIIKEVINNYMLLLNKEEDRVLSLNNVEISKVNSIIELLDLTPFSVLFDNSFPSYLVDKNVSFLLTKSLQSTPLQHMGHIIKQILFTTKVLLLVPCYNLIQGLRTCFNLLRIIIERVTEAEENDVIAKIFNDIKISILEQKDLLSLFLINVIKNQQSNLNFKKYYSILDEFIAELVIYFTNNEINSVIWKTRSAEALYCLQPFKSKLFDQLLHMINSINLYKDRSMSLYDEVYTVFYKFDNFWNEEEIFQLFRNILESKFYNHSLNNHDIMYYKKFLSFLINKLSHTLLITQISEKILIEFFSCHIIEMDSIILQIIEKYLPPGIVEEKNNSLSYISGQQIFHPILSNCLEVSQYFLDNLNSKRAKIVGYLMLCNAEIRELFVHWVLNNQNLLERIVVSDIVILMNSLLEIISTISLLDPKYTQVIWTKFAKVDEKKSIHKISELFAFKFFQNILKSTTTQEKPSIYALITCALLNLSPSQQVLDNLENNIKNELSSDLFNLDFLCIIECHLLDNINYYKEDELKKFISSCLHYATLFIEKDVYKKYSVGFIQAIFTKIDMLIRLCVPKSSNLEANIVGEFIFVLLEKKFEDPIILGCITSFVGFAYNKEEALGPSLDRIVEAIINNSQFRILASPPDLSHKSMESHTFVMRLMICRLLNTLYRTNSKECCKSSYLISLLSIYSATTSISDQLLLDIFILYEKTTKSSIVSSAIKWGTNSFLLNNKNQIDKRGLIMGQRILVETLELIDPMFMMRSFTHFPIDKELEIDCNYIEEFSLFDKRINDISMAVLEKKAPVYDPSYFLPLFANMLSYGNLLDCRKFIEINALGFIIVATSSLVINVRRIAYYLLDEFYVLLEHTYFREKSQIFLLLNSLKNSITNREEDDIQRVPTIITIFIAHSLNIFMNPGHFMYPLINKFLLQRPFLDIKDIPMFYSLFYSSTDNYQKEKVWILRLLSAGLKTYDDYKLFKRRYIWDIISCYHNSPLADNIARKLTIEILFQAASIPKIITDLVKNQGLLTWLHHLCISQEGLSPTSTQSLSEQSLIGTRILLRVLQGCKNSTLKWSNCALIKQSICILTGLLRSLEEISIVKKETLLWTLNYLNSILRIFHYLTLISPTPNNVFSNYHASILISLLEKCEPHLKSITIINNISLSHPIEIQHNYHPSLTDNLDALYAMDHDIVKVYKEIIRILFEMIIINCDKYEDDLVKKIIGRSLSCGVSVEARKWVIGCLADKMDDDKEVNFMDIE
ncbi:ribosome 60S biogenesis N-terminal-domain-containing protein [Glomus cerebriforme]|uniref:Ribosome 60S biogenesis N-terminal-domain-containing protein n=1 Tax=Glomus cerebriforme TaxID=658196 RepID=A0A397TDT2_9GLOM|nr:ribosome 60S biogenesis N-terminal-domain-containing protein [Glomus cerebriforme]